MCIVPPTPPRPNGVHFLAIVFCSSQPCGAEPQGKDLDSTCRKAPVIKLHRPIMSRHNRDIFRVQATLAPRDAGVDGVGGCCGACRAPSSLPWCAHLFGCCSYPEELEEARRESSYLVIRDNAVEFNNPRVTEHARQHRCHCYIQTFIFYAGLCI